MSYRLCAALKGSMTLFKERKLNPYARLKRTLQLQFQVSGDLGEYLPSLILAGRLAGALPFRASLLT